MQFWSLGILGLRVQPTCVLVRDDFPATEMAFLHGRRKREEGERVSGEEKDREKPASWESTNPLGGMPLNGASSL